MADVVLNPKTSALLLQDLQNELIKGNRPVVPLNGRRSLPTARNS